MNFFVFGSILILISLLLVFLVTRSRKKNNRVSEDRKKNLMLHLNDIERELSNFKEEKDMKLNEVNKLKNEVNELIDKAVDGELSGNELENKVREIKTSVTEIKLFTSQQLKRREQLKEQVTKEIGTFKNFLSKNSIYPKDFLFSANMLQGKLVDLDKEKGRKLVKTLNGIENELLSFQKEMNSFMSIHVKVTKWIQKNPEAFANDKQKLFFYLNNGEIKKAEDLFNKLIDTKETPEKQL